MYIRKLYHSTSPCYNVSEARVFANAPNPSDTPVHYLGPHGHNVPETRVFANAPNISDTFTDNLGTSEIREVYEAPNISVHINHLKIASATNISDTFGHHMYTSRIKGSSSEKLHQQPAWQTMQLMHHQHPISQKNTDGTQQHSESSLPSTPLFCRKVGNIEKQTHS